MKCNFFLNSESRVNFDVMSNAFRGENPAFASLISADIGRGEVFPANVENRGLKALQSPILTTKTNNGIQPKPNAVCSFVTQSCSADAVK